jgi:hypothetical protein
LLGGILSKLRDSFTKVSKKEELAAKVLTPEILNKFKSLKDTLLKSILLCFNLVVDNASLTTFLSEIFGLSSLSHLLKTKVLVPQSDFKKL